MSVKKMAIIRIKLVPKVCCYKEKIKDIQRAAHDIQKPKTKIDINIRKE